MHTVKQPKKLPTWGCDCRWYVLAYNCHMQRKSGLPEQLRPFFWDYPFSKLSITKDRDLIVRRILANGSWDAVRWLRKTLGDQALREWLIVHRGRGLTARQLRFWGLLYDLPVRQVNQWVKTAKAGVWERR
jgi:hypothetical protein